MHAPNPPERWVWSQHHAIPQLHDAIHEKYAHRCRKTPAIQAPSMDVSYMHSNEGPRQLQGAAQDAQFHPFVQVVRRRTYERDVAHRHKHEQQCRHCVRLVEKRKWRDLFDERSRHQQVVSLHSLYQRIPLLLQHLDFSKHWMQHEVTWSRRESTVMLARLTYTAPYPCSSLS